MVGRRGPVHAAFTANEFRELLTFPDLKVIFREEDLLYAQNDTASQEILKSSRKHHRIFDLLGKACHDPDIKSEKRLFLHFNRTPHSILGDSNNHVKTLRLSVNNSGIRDDFHDIPCNLLIPSIGYAPVVMPEVPRDASGTHVAHKAGRVDNLPGVYVAGWLKRGPQGVIADNRWDAQETIASLVEDLPKLPKILRVTDADDPLNIFRDKIEFSEWLQIDAAEIAAGQAIGKPREKFTSNTAIRRVLSEIE